MDGSFTGSPSHWTLNRYRDQWFLRPFLLLTRRCRSSDLLGGGGCEHEQLQPLAVPTEDATLDPTEDSACFLQLQRCCVYEEEHLVTALWLGTT